ncbi:hypothetical protein T09_15253, partial [Trichinella sp. T9]
LLLKRLVNKHLDHSSTVRHSLFLYFGERMMKILLLFLLLFCVVFYNVGSVEVCPNDLECPHRCCASAGNPNKIDYFCCDEELERIYVIGLSNWWKHNSPVFVGCLIASIVISVLLSLLCCFFCNGCWCYKRRHRADLLGGACVNSFPFGTIIYSPYPPTVNNCQPTVNGVNQASRPRVHFEDDHSSSCDTYDRLRPALKSNKV